MRLGRDGIAGLIGLAVSLALLPFAFGLPKLPIVPIGPGFYPTIVLVFMAAMSALLVLQDVRGAARSRRRTRQAEAGGARARLRAGARGLRRRGRLHRPAAAARLSASPRRCSSPLSSWCWSGRRTARQWAMLAGHRRRHLGASPIWCSSTICRCCCRAAAGRAGDPCSSCSAPASSRSCSGNICCRCSWARWPAWSAARCRASPSP